ncbi:MAG: 23S rRNA (pseudouridine(1915)-N(3))-methyltransferase RlmH [Candidatus Moraniibacteriota bacterium]
MPKITILAIGKMKDRNFADAFGEYIKRINPFAMVSIQELSAESFFDNSDRERIKNKEGQRIKNYLEKRRGGRIIVLDEGGRQIDSKNFSQLLFEAEGREIIFVVGGTLGLSAEILNLRQVDKISFSKMTFPHELVRVILAEQIYRSIAINKNKRYHY